MRESIRQHSMDKTEEKIHCLFGEALEADIPQKGSTSRLFLALRIMSHFIILPLLLITHGTPHTDSIRTNGISYMIQQFV